ncbi:hypothetical protein [Nonomuraea zeae]|uniref:WXG100 family type VII secretion target n=1 Tax=Nonomuraea zeae TaxID=1642303 RepID=A0A5S4GT28_9ACTN|nr:hypothetical protein [Nonomuraea zeae]TMR35989.1 hypothetical protein ETD85_12260 [Nonomuraea zeae]
MASTENGWRLEQSWPGLVADRDGVEYSPVELGNVANILQGWLREVNGSALGCYPDVERQGWTLDMFAQQLEQVKNWEGGRSFARALRQSHEELAKVYKEVNDTLSIAVLLIDAGAGNYTRANTVNES